MQQSNKKNKTKLKTIALLATISIATSCASNKRHKKLALKITKNNYEIIQAIKNERKHKELEKLIKSNQDLYLAEKRLQMALDALQMSNDSLKSEFKTNHLKEVYIDRR